MNSTHTISALRVAKTLIASAAIGAAATIGAVPASAEPVPSYASGSTDQTITGTITAITGKYTISVRDAHGYIDNVSLHPGTIINPTGLELAAGQSVTIVGQPHDRTFIANEIDTPYQNVLTVPLYPGYGYGYGYGRGYGYPEFGAGLHVGRGFGFGFRG